MPSRHNCAHKLVINPCLPGLKVCYLSGSDWLGDTYKRGAERMAQTAQSRGTVDIALIYTPLLVFPLILYVFLAFTGILGQRVLAPDTPVCAVDGTGSPIPAKVMIQNVEKDCVVTVEQGLGSTMFSLTMFSGDKWHVSFGDIFLILCLLLLFVETIKSTRTDAAAIVNHGLSMVVAVVCIILFITTNGFSNTVFLLLTMMQLLDVVAGFTVTIVGAKRDFGASPGVAGTG